jgi:hypothetical protein
MKYMIFMIGLSAGMCVVQATLSEQEQAFNECKVQCALARPKGAVDLSDDDLAATTDCYSQCNTGYTGIDLDEPVEEE